MRLPYRSSFPNSSHLKRLCFSNAGLLQETASPALEASPSPVPAATGPSMMMMVRGHMQKFVNYSTSTSQRQLRQRGILFFGCMSALDRVQSSGLLRAHRKPPLPLQWRWLPLRLQWTWLLLLLLLPWKCPLLQWRWLLPRQPQRPPRCLLLRPSRRPPRLLQLLHSDC